MRGMMRESKDAVIQENDPEVKTSRKWKMSVRVLTSGVSKKKK